MSESRRIMILPLTVEEFLALPPEDADCIEAAVYLEGTGDGAGRGPFVPGWSSVRAEIDLAEGEPVPAHFDCEGVSNDFFVLVGRNEDGSYHVVPPWMAEADS